MKYFTLSFLLFLTLNSQSHPFTPCDEVAGMADIYPCENIDLMQRVHIDVMGGDGNDTGSDIWGWTDSTTGKEYAITALNSATTFIDISDPKNPIYLGRLPTASVDSLWRDVKTYNNYAFIVSEASSHGMQVFDLTRLRNVVNPPVNFTQDAHYSTFGRAHNIVINEDSGFAYAVGTREGSQPCSQGLHMINIQNPLSPTFAGCFSADGYTHDAQCVTYIGPDTQHNGKEICFNSNEDTVTVVDVSDKSNPIQLSRTGYSGSQYTHQGWLTEDQRYYLMNDELDEQNNGHNTKTYIWDMLDIDSPQLIGFYNGPKASIDHNIYIRGNYAYLSNYTSGLRIVDITDIGNANLTEVASFDTYPANDTATFNGAWSNYPYFSSGIVIMSDYQGGLFILDPKICPTIATAQGITTQANGDNTIDINWTLNLGANETYKVLRSQGGCSVDDFVEIASGLTSNSFSDTSVTGQVPVGYKIVKVDAQGTCESDRSICVETQITGNCTIAPDFSGVASVSSLNSATCGVNVSWQNANSYCGSSVNYDVFKSTNPGFTADISNRIANNLTTTSLLDEAVADSQEYYYLVRATDISNNNQDTNNVKLATTAHGIITDGTWNNGAEVGDTGFNQASKHLGWEYNTLRKHAGNRSFWSQSQSSICNDLVTNAIALTAGQTSQLSFWSAYDIENQYDGGVVEVTTDQNQWDQNPLTPSYPGTFNSSGNACNYTAGTPSFTGTNLTWQQHTMDLSAYQGQTIYVRWNYSTDSGVNNEGWYLDDFSITHSQVPSQCITLTDLLYRNSFE